MNTHKYDNVTLQTVMTPKGFELYHGEFQRIGFILRDDTDLGYPLWLVQVEKAPQRAFTALKAAEYYALASYIELRVSEELEYGNEKATEYSEYGAAFD